MSPQEFAAKIRAKYPTAVASDGRAYADIDDDELTTKIIEKYPVYQRAVKMPSYVDRVGSTMAAGADMVGESFKTSAENIGQDAHNLQKNNENADAVTKVLNFAMFAGHTAGNVARTAGDVALGTAKAAIAPLTQVKTPAGDTIGSRFATPVKQQVQKAVPHIEKAFTDFKTANPDMAPYLDDPDVRRGLEDVMNTMGMKAAKVMKADAVAPGAKDTVTAIKAGAVDITQAANTAAAKAKQAVTRAPAAANQEALDITTRVFNKKTSVAALEKSGRPGGFKDSDSIMGKLLGQTEYVPDAKDIRVADSVADVVSAKNSPPTNIQNIYGKIEKTSKEQIEPMLTANPGAFNVKTYNAHLRSIEPPDYVKTDATLEKTYDLVRQRFVEVTSRHPKTKLGLWRARKELDTLLEEHFGKGVFDPEKYGVYQRAVADMRRATNDFINEGIADDGFKKAMQNLSDMYTARTRIALDNYRVANSNRFTRWAADNPKKAKALGIIISGAGAYGVYQQITN